MPKKNVSSYNGYHHYKKLHGSHGCSWSELPQDLKKMYSDSAKKIRVIKKKTSQQVNGIHNKN